MRNDLKAEGAQEFRGYDPSCKTAACARQSATASRRSGKTAGKQLGVSNTATYNHYGEVYGEKSLSDRNNVKPS